MIITNDCIYIIYMSVLSDYKNTFATRDVTINQ